MRDRTKEIVKDGFASLVNNAAAIRGAKAGPLWLTIVMFVLSVFLPVVPIFVSNITTNGDSFLNSYSYGLERYVTKVGMDLEDELYKFGIDSEHMLTIKKDGVDVDFDAYGATQPLASYKDQVTNEYTLQLYISSAIKTADKKDVYNAISNRYYATGSDTVTEYDKNDASASYRPSYLILFKDSVFMQINKGSKAIKNSLGGDYKTIKEKDDYLAELLTVTSKEGVLVDQDITNRSYTDGVYRNFRRFLNKSYETLRIRNTFATSGIYLAIFFGLSIVMGFLMWLLTRGKNNPNNYYTPWLTMKIQGRLGLAPALITLIVGFFLTSYAPLIYIMTIGLRAMWISMKELRPVQQ